MPTSFNTSFDDSGDDIIHASHVTQYAAPINALETAIDLKENVAEKGVAGGYAELDGTGKVPASQLPEPGASDLDDLTDVAVSGPMPDGFAAVMGLELYMGIAGMMTLVDDSS